MGPALAGSLVCERHRGSPRYSMHELLVTLLCAHHINIFGLSGLWYFSYKMQENFSVPWKHCQDELDLKKMNKTSLEEVELLRGKMLWEWKELL